MTAQEAARDFLALVDRLTSLEQEVEHLRRNVNELVGMVFRDSSDESR